MHARGRFVKTRWLLRTFAFVTALSPTLPGSARAVTIASDSFADTTGALAGQGGGSGWSGAWITGQPAVFQVQPASLSPGPGASGGSLLFDGAHAVSGTG